jgi:hypothetical protein
LQGASLESIEANPRSLDDSEKNPPLLYAGCPHGAAIVLLAWLAMGSRAAIVVDPITAVEQGGSVDTVNVMPVLVQVSFDGPRPSGVSGARSAFFMLGARAQCAFCLYVVRHIDGFVITKQMHPGHLRQASTRFDG